jgi:pSer/pThr/pTyr-binding forkhead associated (FHA) protein
MRNEKGQYYYRIVDGSIVGGQVKSSNGLTVCGRRVDVHDLSHGDEVFLSDETRLTYLVAQYKVSPRTDEPTIC